MTVKLDLGSVTIHRIVEQEAPLFRCRNSSRRSPRRCSTRTAPGSSPTISPAASRAVRAELHRQDAAPHHHDRFLRRQPQASAGTSVLAHDAERPVRAEPGCRRASASATSTMSCARTCTATTSAGTRGSTTGAGCRPFPRPSTCLPTANSSSGPQKEKEDASKVPWMTDSVLPIVAAGRHELSGATTRSATSCSCCRRPGTPSIISRCRSASPARTPSSPAT